MMKLPTLFGKIPKHKRYSYVPRFYDPQKEEREARMARKRAESGQSDESVQIDRKTRMSEAFRSHRQQQRTSILNFRPALIRSGLMLFMTLLLIGWLQWGNIALYGLLVAVPAWLYVRFVRK